MSAGQLWALTDEPPGNYVFETRADPEATLAGRGVALTEGLE